MDAARLARLAQRRECTQARRRNGGSRGGWRRAQGGHLSRLSVSVRQRVRRGLGRARSRSLQRAPLLCERVRHLRSVRPSVAAAAAPSSPSSPPSSSSSSPRRLVVALLVAPPPPLRRRRRRSLAVASLRVELVAASMFGSSSKHRRQGAFTSAASASAPKATSMAPTASEVRRSSLPMGGLLALLARSPSPDLARSPSPSPPNSPTPIVATASAPTLQPREPSRPPPTASAAAPPGHQATSSSSGSGSGSEASPPSPPPLATTPPHSTSALEPPARLAGAASSGRLALEHTDDSIEDELRALFKRRLSEPTMASPLSPSPPASASGDASWALASLSMLEALVLEDESELESIHARTAAGHEPEPEVDADGDCLDAAGLPPKTSSSAPPSSSPATPQLVVITAQRNKRRRRGASRPTSSATPPSSGSSASSSGSSSRGETVMSPRRRSEPDAFPTNASPPSEHHLGAGQQQQQPHATSQPQLHPALQQRTSPQLTASGGRECASNAARLSASVVQLLDEYERSRAMLAVPYVPPAPPAPAPRRGSLPSLAAHLLLPLSLSLSLSHVGASPCMTSAWLGTRALRRCSMYVSFPWLRAEPVAPRELTSSIATAGGHPNLEPATYARARRVLPRHRAEYGRSEPPGRRGALGAQHAQRHGYVTATGTTTVEVEVEPGGGLSRSGIGREAVADSRGVLADTMNWREFLWTYAFHSSNIELFSALVEQFFCIDEQQADTRLSVRTTYVRHRCQATFAWHRITMATLTLA